MPVVVRAQHIFNAKTGVVEDQVVNTWYFETTDADIIGPTMAAELASIIWNFYNEAPSGGQAMHTFMPHKVMGAPRETIKFYDMDADKPRAPFATISPVTGIASNTLAPLPAEVAVCLSYRGLNVSGLAPARRRGRLYLGPLAISTGTTEDDTITGQSRPALALRSNIILNAQKLKTQAAAAGFDWVVYSPSLRGSGPASNGTTAIAHVWVDNAWDTQRRRGLKPTTRSTADVIAP